MQGRQSKACARASFVSVALTLLACSDEPNLSPDEPRTCLDPAQQTVVPDFPLTYETDHIDIYLEEGQFLCAGSAHDYEQFVSYVGAHSGEDIQRRIPVYLAEGVSNWCPEYAGGCTKGDGVIFSRAFSTHHELGHAVICETRFNAPRMLAEGFAVSYEPTANSEVGDPTEFSELHQDDFTAYYGRAGHFVRWLQQQLGPDGFLDLYTSASYTAGVWAAVETAYGTMVEADYHATAPAMWVPHRQCDDLLILEPSGEQWLFEATFDCDDASTLGPYERVGASAAQTERTAMYQSFLIEIPMPGTYRFERPDSIADGFTDVRIERCLDGHPTTEQGIAEQWVKQSGSSHRSTKARSSLSTRACGEWTCCASTARPWTCG
jgi:hypothetical protein